MEDTYLPEKCAGMITEVIPSLMQAMRQEIRGYVKDEISVPQFRVLARLSAKPANNGELADWVGVSLPAMSRMVDLLFKRGLVERNVPSSDRRQVNISLTSKGERFHQQAKVAGRKIFERKLSVIPNEKVELLIEAFKILNILFIDPEDSHEKNSINFDGVGRRKQPDSLRTATIGRRQGPTTS